MLQPSNPYIQKIMYIRDVIINRAYDAPGADMSFYMHDCKTPSCVLGHVIHDPVMEMQGLIPHAMHDQSYDGCIIGIVQKRLGISGHTGLFGIRATREERKAICDHIIKRMLAEVIQVKE